MTREEAIKVLNMVEAYGLADEAKRMAIKALEQESCADCISRQAVLDKIKEICFSKEQKWVDFRVSQGSNGQRDLIIKFIESLPSIQPKPKTGHWIDSGIYGEIDGQITKAYTCSICGAISIFRVSDGHIINADNCPNCGAKMVEPQESEDKE